MTATFSAKQVATRIGTDAKTLRKFLRSSSSPFDAVGQGKRYEFTTRELAQIREAFNKWQSKSRARSTAPQPAEVKKVVEGIKKGTNRLRSDIDRDAPLLPDSPTMLSHAAVIGDKGKCLKVGCGMVASHRVHIKPERKVDPDSARRTREAELLRQASIVTVDDDAFSDEGDDLGPEPTEADLDEIEDLLEDLED